MKFLSVFIFTFLLFYTGSALSEVQHSIISNQSSKSLLLDIIATEQSRFIAVGERGHILSGSNLDDVVQHKVPTRATLTAVTQVNDKVWAVGHDLTIVHSADSGQSWTLQFSAPEFDKPFLDVLFFDESEGIAIGAYGAFYRTIDGGKSWQQELNATLLHPDDIDYLEEIRELDGEAFYLEELANILPHLNRVEVIDNVLYMVGEMGLLAVSLDKGATWQRIELPYEGSLFAVNASSGSLYVAGLRGNNFLRKNNQWLKIDLCNQATINSVFSHNKKLITLANNGYVGIVDVDTVNSDVSCEDSSVKAYQDAQKVALINAVSVNNRLISVTANGLLALTLEQ